MLFLAAKGGELGARIGPRIPMTVGPLVMAAGSLLLLRSATDVNYWPTSSPGMTIFGLGLALMVAPLTATVLAAAPDEHAGIASGVNNAVARAGSLLAVAALPIAVGPRRRRLRRAGGLRRRLPDGDDGLRRAARGGRRRVLGDDPQPGPEEEGHTLYSGTEGRDAGRRAARRWAELPGRALPACGSSPADERRRDPSDDPHPVGHPEPEPQRPRRSPIPSTPWTRPASCQRRWSRPTC